MDFFTMIIDCINDPNELIDKIGDRYFSICDDSWDEIYRHPDHPHTLRIIDCEDEVRIDVMGESSEGTFQMAHALCKLLNQEYVIK